MTTIKSKTVQVNAPANELYALLDNLENLEKLMPADRISDWQATPETCSFQIKGLAKIGMKRNGGSKPTQLELVSNGKNPFEFTLNIMFKEAKDATEAQLIFEGNMNAMLAMMAKQPLTNFFNMLADKLVEINA